MKFTLKHRTLLTFLAGFFLLGILVGKDYMIFATEDSDNQNIESNLTALDSKLEKVFGILDTKNYYFQERFYKTFKEHFSKSKIFTKEDDVLANIVYIESKIDSKFEEYVIANNTRLALIAEEKRLAAIEAKKIKSHKSLILKFVNNGNHAGVIAKNKQLIKDIRSVFIFRGGKNLSRTDIKYITTELVKINDNLLIFIDQEGGLINRYVEFETAGDVNNFFDTEDTYLTKRFNLLTDGDIATIRNIFPQYSGYYPSLEKLGNGYDIFGDAIALDGVTKKTQLYLEIIAYIRLQTLKNNGINTYGLVADLNRGNIVIGGNARSFSTHVYKYKELIDAFVKASEQTGVTVYLKHFPGHGTGGVDTHKGVLSLVGKEDYLIDNLDVFSYFINHSGFSGDLLKGFMVGHMYIPNSVRGVFDNAIDVSDYLLTDDLGMQGYKLATGKEKDGLFFTTDAIAKSKNLIIVDTVNAVTVY